VRAAAGPQTSLSRQRPGADGILGSQLDNDDRLRRTQPPLHQGVDGAAAGAASLRFWLEYQGHNIELRPGNVLVGRSSSCHVVLDDALFR
jgi:hypothetical protein